MSGSPRRRQPEPRCAEPVYGTAAGSFGLAGVLFGASMLSSSGYAVNSKDQVVPFFAGPQLLRSGNHLAPGLAAQARF
jgi:hypothetical protein